MKFVEVIFPNLPQREPIFGLLMLGDIYLLTCFLVLMIFHGLPFCASQNLGPSAFEGNLCIYQFAS